MFRGEPASSSIALTALHVVQIVCVSRATLRRSLDIGIQNIRAAITPMIKVIIVRINAITNRVLSSGNTNQRKRIIIHVRYPPKMNKMCLQVSLIWLALLLGLE